MVKKQTQQHNENKKLTPEQKEFCREVANGLSARLAYIKAFNCKESAASASASRMLTRVNIKEEINRLREKTHEVHAARTEGQENRKLWTKAERMERLQQWAQECAGAGDIATAIKCVDTLNKMDGAYDTKAETGIGGLTAKRIMPYEAQNTAASILNKLKAAHEQRLASS